MITDTHCHLHFKDFDADRDAVIARAREAGVGRMVIIGTDPDTNEQAFRLASGFKFMKNTMGLHPHHSHEVPQAEIELFEKKIGEYRPAAIGEIGLDYFKSEGEADTQKRVFRRMLALAREHGLPVIVHSRSAFDDTYEILQKEAAGKVRGVMHCFSYDREAQKKIAGIGFLASFTCNITYKNAAALLEVAKDAPLDEIMLETDSPYLSPQTHRGQRNEPSRLAELVPFLAAARGESPERVAAVTSATAQRFFGFGE